MPTLIEAKAKYHADAAKRLKADEAIDTDFPPDFMTLDGEVYQFFWSGFVATAYAHIYFCDNNQEIRVFTEDMQPAVLTEKEYDRQRDEVLEQIANSTDEAVDAFSEWWEK